MTQSNDPVREAFDADQMLRDNEWAKWSDARELLEIVYAMGMKAALSQPPQAQPLSGEELAAEASRRWKTVNEPLTFEAGARWAERRHGITKGGNE